MNIPFPVLTPRLVDSKWFNADSPCDEEAEIVALENTNQIMVSQIPSWCKSSIYKNRRFNSRSGTKQMFTYLYCTILIVHSCWQLEM